jgi:itaconate CoA-transferase
MLVQAESGVVSVTGSAEAMAKVGISVADIASGMYAYSSILAALYDRERTGRGARIDISMLECLTEWMMPPLYVWQGTGAIPPRVGVRHNMIVPYGAYACADGVVLFAIQNDREWRRFCADVLSNAELADDGRFVSNAQRLANRRMLESIIEIVFRERPRAELEARLEHAGIATARVNDVPDVAEHPQLRARERWTTVDSPRGPIRALIPPHNLSRMEPRMGRIPALGEHTADVLAELANEVTDG